jgi:hypothetical protein
MSHSFKGSQSTGFSRLQYNQKVLGRTWIDNHSLCGYDVSTLEDGSMTASVKGRVIKIGNSQGIRIPKLLLEQSGIQGNVNIEVRDDRLIITAASSVRLRN